MLNAILCCFSLTADPATWKNSRHLAKGCLYPLALSPYTWSACLYTLITYISCHITVGWLHFSFYTSATVVIILLSCDLIDFQFSDLVALEWDNFCFSLCRCYFIELPALLIPKSLKKKNLCWSTFLNFNFSEKNVLKDYLIVGKPCVCQRARFLMDSSCRADCCFREHRGNEPKLNIENGTCL